MSSIHEQAAFAPSKAVDGDLKTYAHTKTVEAFPWIALQISDSIQLVRKVVVVNWGSGGQKASSTAARFRNVEVRVAVMVPTTAAERFAGGSLLGTFEGPGKPGETVEFSDCKGVMGKYVVIQCSSNQHLHITEVAVYTDYSHE